MCPFCFATVGLIVAGAVSTGGLATLALKVSEEKSDSTGTGWLRGHDGRRPGNHGGGQSGRQGGWGA
jgi:hypothetical protein